MLYHYGSLQLYAGPEHYNYLGLADKVLKSPDRQLLAAMPTQACLVEAYPTGSTGLARGNLGALWFWHADYGCQ